MRWTALAIGLLCAHASTAAWAESSAAELVDAGVNQRAAGKDAEALTLFQRAYAMEKSSRTLAQIALAEQALGRWLDAHRDLSRALADDKDGWIKTNRPTLQGALTAISGNLGQLVLSASTDGATARIEGGDAIKLPATVRVMPGKVKVEVRASGYTTASKTVEVAAGDKVPLSMELVKVAPRVTEPRKSEPVVTKEEPPPDAPVAPPPAVLPPHPDPPRERGDVTAQPLAEEGDTLRTLAWVSGGAGAVSLLTGIVLAAVSEPSDFDCTFDEFGELSCANPGQAAGIGLVVLGVALGVTSGVLFGVSAGDEGSTASLLTLSGCGVGGQVVSCAWAF